MKTLIIRLALVVSSLVSINANAALWGTDASAVLTGSRDTGSTGGVTATDPWTAGGFSLSWDISQAGNLWTYEYAVNTTGGVKTKDISHFLLEVTETEDPFNTYAGTDPVEGPQAYFAGSSGNPGLPNDLYGVKFDFGSDDGSITYTFVTDRAPVWGVFYAKDGTHDSHFVYAYSDALAFADYRTNDDLTQLDFIVRPDGITVVPEPSTMALLGLGLILLGSIAVRRRI